MHVHVYYACICGCIYGVYIWIYIFSHCVYKRACYIFCSYDHVHIEKEKKSSGKKWQYDRERYKNLSENENQKLLSIEKNIIERKKMLYNFLSFIYNYCSGKESIKIRKTKTAKAVISCNSSSKVRIICIN